jgi:hypothetical protein
MFLLVVVLLLAISVWAAYGRPGGSFLPEFAKLLDRSKIVAGKSDARITRARLDGEFRGRNVVILLERWRRQFSNRIEVSLQTQAATTLETFSFTGDKVDREGELALFALEVNHELKLAHEDGHLKASRVWPSLFGFADRFDRAKWQSVLDAMHTLAGSLERREAR